MSHLFLTEEQKAVVNHNHGPALVFAVAGAGKTTAMVHRIDRLIREQVFQAPKILATSFSKATVEDIRQSLKGWHHCAGVKVSTLHAVGLSILRKAHYQGRLRELNLSGRQDAVSDQLLLKRALGRARQQGVDIPNNLDEQDFLSYISVCKGNFLYPNLKSVHLPSAALSKIQAAEAPETLEYYLDLFEIFENLRKELGLITFDDMLLSAWEVLHQNEDLLHWSQQQYDCVLVDEFQDVNAVQNELLDLISHKHQNYMVIGDDDQTIYEWRGASPKFILDFPRHFQAKKFLLSENFRSQASHLALANQVIAHNTEREPKSLLLTRGFGGKTRVSIHPSEQAQAEQLILDIMSSAQSGYTFDQQAVLLRLYAQSPYLEQALIEANIPYRMIGSAPFYYRAEIRTLMAYVKLAQFEIMLREGILLTGSQKEDFYRLWMRIANRPVRYLKKHWLQWLPAQVQSGQTLVHSLNELATRVDTAYQKKLTEKLAILIDWLCLEGLHQEASKTLEKMEQDLKYCQYLKKSSGFPETGEGRALTVEAFIKYSKDKGHCKDLEQHLHTLAQQQQNTEQAITLTSIFRAKGLEWPVVYVPHCNQGFIPYSSAHSLEEERRLFYVALTRPREQLYLYALKELPLSRFLSEAAYQETLVKVKETQQLLNRDNFDWNLGEVVTLIHHSRSLKLHTYLQNWWQHHSLEEHSLYTQAGQLLLQAKAQNLLEPLNFSSHDLKDWQVSVSDFSEELSHSIKAYLHEQKEMAPLAKEASATSQTADNFLVGDQVWSENFGLGTIQSCHDNEKHGVLLEVLFENGEAKKILPKFSDLQVIVS